MNAPLTGELWRELIERKAKRERMWRALYPLLIVGTFAAFYWSL